MQHRPTVAEIDLDHLKANARRLRGSLTSGAFFCPMVKANAYGHGAIEVARALRAENVTHVGVALIEEGIALRQSGDKGEILVFGLFDETSVETFLWNGLTPVLGSWSQARALEKAAGALDGKIKIHIEFNTGMNRLGFPVADAAKVRAWLDTQPRLQLAGICTHFSRGEDLGRERGDSEPQFAAFSKALDAFAGLKFDIHALNSGAVAAFAKSPALKERFEKTYGPLGARPGIALYGVQGADDPSLAMELEPVLSFKTRVASKQHVRAGERVSYNGIWRAERDSVIGVLPVGYADGFSRGFSNRGVVLARGRRVPVVGVVCMDYVMVDLTDLERETGPIAIAGETDSSLGAPTEIVLIGKQGTESITASDLAQLLGTIAYEVLTNIGPRVARRHLERE